MSNLRRIALIVNQEVPNFGLDVLRPREMQRTRTSNCVGRAVLAFTALRMAGTPEDQMSLLVSVHHATPNQKGKYWYGHTALAIDGEGVIDSIEREAFRRDLDATWLPGDKTQLYRMDHTRYTVHGVNEGLVDYQLRHPDLAAGPIVTTEDYMDVYGELLQAVGP